MPKLKHKRCPFCASNKQITLPCEVQAQHANGKYKPEVWRVVVCSCMVTGRAGRSEKAAWANWNMRNTTAPATLTRTETKLIIAYTLKRESATKAQVMACGA